MKRPELAGNSGCFPRLRFCPVGHDKDELGRTSNGSCRACDRARSVERRRLRATVTGVRLPHRSPMLPFAPLGAALAERHLAYSWFDKNTERNLFRARLRGSVSIFLADEVLCSIGIHPASVYGDAFYTAERPTKEAS